MTKFTKGLLKAAVVVAAAAVLFFTLGPKDLDGDGKLSKSEMFAGAARLSGKIGKWVENVEGRFGKENKDKTDDTVEDEKGVISQTREDYEQSLREDMSDG